MQVSDDTLEAQLAEKEQLVAALTERLEQAAEQLDRLHRTGADRGLRAGFAGLPPELIQQQQKLVEDLQRAVQQWEEMQPGAFFARLETQLGHFEEMAQNFQRPDGGSGAGSAYSQQPRDLADPHERHESRSDSGQSPSSILHLMPENLQAVSTSKKPFDNSDDHAAATGSDAAAAPLAAVNLPALEDPPPSIDIAAAAANDLRQACADRDSYIIYLLHRLRQVETAGYSLGSWAELENVPGEMRGRLQSLEKRLEETLRLAEVELSLQRAKLAREEARVRNMDDQIQKELKRVRETTDDDNEETENQPAGSGSSGRWKRMLSRRKRDDA